MLMLLSGAIAKNPRGLFFSITMLPEKCVFKIPIQMRCVLSDIASILSRLNIEVK